MKLLPKNERCILLIFLTIFIVFCTHISSDADENRAPVFSEGARATRAVAENTAPGTNIGAAFTATDPDSGDTLTYSLHRGDKDSFRIDPNTGQLQTRASLDYETKNAYTDLAVRVTDSSGLTDAILVTINVTDVKENRVPVFIDGGRAIRTIAENTPAGVNIGTPVAATDADNDVLTYSLGWPQESSSFSIDSTTGQIRTKAPLDYETKNVYHFAVFVDDGNDGKRAISTTINVTDVNETPANNAPILTDGDSTTRTVAENTAAGVNIGAPIAATDADTGDTLTCTLGGPDASSFSINGTTGQLRTNAALDYETKSSYSVTVSVSDGNGGSDSIAVTINLTNVNEAPSFATSTATRSIAENTAPNTNIGTPIAATDVDGGTTLTYTLDGTDAASFSINSTNGQLRTSAALDYETKTSYSVIVSASDGNGGSDSITVTINVTDVNGIDPPLSDRTQQVRDAIVAAVPGVYNADDVTAAHLAVITNLDLSAKDITSLKSGDFNGLSALTELDLGSNSINDISALEDLSALTELDLSSNSISDISALEDLSALTELDLGSNSISDISALEDLSALTKLYLGSNSISDISVLEDLSALTELYLGSNSISDISVLEDLSALTELDLGSNSINDISALEDLSALTELYLSSNSISDISVLEDLTALTKLYLGSNSIKDISVLEDLTALTKLSLNFNSIGDISVLEDLTALTHLYLQRTSISDISALEGLTALKHLILRYNSISDISALEGLTALTHLFLTGNPISDYGPLRRLEAAIQAAGGSLYVENFIPVEGRAPSVQVSPVIPDNTALLTNFPNPFNPETWIPYQLAKPAEVRLTIYDIRGVVVRELKLGHQPAGFYDSHSRAIYWDGRNNIGEKVATGIYFYTLKAGDFTATRKLLIRK